MQFPDWLNAILLGIIEGLTEFLPVSSTGHLMVFGKLLGFNEEVFIVFIQIGALSAVWWLFRHRILSMIPFGPTSTPEGRQTCWNVLLAFMPAAIVGFLTKDWDRDRIEVIAWATLIGGVLILIIERTKKQPFVQKMAEITPRLALIVGIGQCLALCPGVSRSGATIMTGLVIGLSRPVIAEFTFLLAVPTMTAAGVLELWKFRDLLTGEMIGLLAIGFVVSYFVAFAVVKWFIRFVQTHTFDLFAWYRIVVGAILLWCLWTGALKV
jgi:undecaprenyl-diphosphatase